MTSVVALLIALFATWVTGGFADAQLVPLSLSDPSPLLAFVWPKWAAVYAISHLAFAGSQGAVRHLATAPA